MIRRAAVLGSPIGHSLSPVVHRAAYQHLGLDWLYEKIDLGVDELRPFVEARDASWAGLSVTMPLKEAAATCGVPNADVVLTGAANTIVFGAEPHVYNTDIDGLMDMLDEGDARHLRTATVIGNGATAKSATVALARRGVQLVEVQGRSQDRLESFRRWAAQIPLEVQPRTLGAPIDPATQVLISTVPTAALASRLDTLQVELCQELRTVIDVIYHPWPTPLADRAQAAGLPLFSGLDLLVRQARHQVRLMTGQDVPLEVLLSAVRAEMLTRHGT